MYGSLILCLVKKNLPSLSYITFSVIKRALLGNSTRLSHKINTLNREYSISDLISIGVYINSLTKVEETVSVVPTLNLVSIQYFCNMYEEEGKKEGDAKIVVEILKDMLDIYIYR
uniref:Uncharacterized protein n=1 Tax=Rhizophagus irregularis (strain DAOM 181602 / DAOM 197198 / MUCL 43194) TaxID=747089 RepID=U9SU39_RHIID